MSEEIYSDFYKERIAAGCNQNCLGLHVEECALFDPAIAYRNLKSSIQQLQKCLSDGFEVEMFATSVEFVVKLKHPTQLEEFMGDDLLEIVHEIDGWVSHCSQGD